MTFNLVIPMAGAGSRFCDAGYMDPKPLIEVNGTPMFKLATENVIDLCAPYQPINIIFIIDALMDMSFNLSYHIKKHFKGAKIVTLNERTDGAASTVRAASAYLDPEIPVVVANCDQYIGYDSTSFSSWMEQTTAGIVVFHCPERDPKWSYAQVNNYGRVQRVAEKDPISDLATAGIYYWSTAAIMLNSIGSMMKNNDRTNGEFYLCPSYNYTIQNGYEVTVYAIDEMHGLGTPEDLEQYLLYLKG